MWQFIKNRMMNWMKELFWSIIHSLPPVDSRGSYCNSFVYEKEIHQFFKIKQMKEIISKGWGQSVKLGPQSAIWEKLGTALQAYTLNPCTKFPPNPTSRKVNT